jgi:DNA (cytosine-5)-methyltransferase 1
MANAYGGRSSQPSDQVQAGWDESGFGGKDVANADETRLQGFGTEHQLREGQSEESTGRIGWWESEPDVGRVAYGVPGRVHRLKALGNAIVPQIAEEIGRAILKAEETP